MVLTALSGMGAGDGGTVLPALDGAGEGDGGTVLPAAAGDGGILLEAGSLRLVNGEKGRGDFFPLMGWCGLVVVGAVMVGSNG